MPQMYPLNWIILFTMFMLIYFLFLIVNYYNYNKLLNNSNFSMENKPKIKYWKW